MFGFGRKGVNKNAEPVPQGQPGDLKGPLFNAFHYIGFVSTPGRDSPDTIVTRAYEPSVCFGPDNIQGRSFLIEIQGGGTGKGYLFAPFGSIWVDGEPGPRAQIPTEMTANKVPGYQEALNELLSGPNVRT